MRIVGKEDVISITVCKSVRFYTALSQESSSSSFTAVGTLSTPNTTTSCVVPCSSPQ